VHSLYHQPVCRAVIVLLLLASPLVYAESKEVSLELDDGAEMPIEVYPSSGNKLVIWLTSEFGLSPRQATTAKAMGELGMEVWMPDLHSTWFIPIGRYSLNDVDPAAVQKLIEQALQTNKTVYLMVAGRVNVLALHAVRRLQQSGVDTQKLAGLISFGPRLFIRTPQGGEEAEFLPIAHANNLPIYVLQPENSGGFWRTHQVVEALAAGGSPVFTHTLHNVGNGFNTRPEFTPQEADMTARLPGIIAHACKQLAQLGGTPATPAPMQGEETAPERASGSALLKPYPVKRQAPALKLPTLAGKNIDLNDLKGKVVMVNFWATWCPPCVEEIPSLQRLYAAKKAKGLEILAVDVGETPEKMQQFLADKPIEFPVLMDVDGSALKTWGVHAFPTTLVLDRQHQIRYAVFGAFAWDSAEVLQTLAPLFN
jgi:peroxiredoxin